MTSRWVKWSNGETRGFTCAPPAIYTFLVGWGTNLGAAGVNQEVNDMPERGSWRVHWWVAPAPSHLLLATPVALSDSFLLRIAVAPASSRVCTPDVRGQSKTVIGRPARWTLPCSAPRSYVASFVQACVRRVNWLSQVHWHPSFLEKGFRTSILLTDLSNHLAHMYVLQALDYSYGTTLSTDCSSELSRVKCTIHEMVRSCHLGPRTFILHF